MSQRPQRSLRLTPISSTNLNPLTGVSGELFYDSTNQTLRLFTGLIQGGFQLARSDLVNVDNSVFLAKAQTSLVGQVASGSQGRLAWYPNTGRVVDDLANVSWASGTLTGTGTVTATGQKNRMRFHWDTLTDLIAEVSPIDYHGMLAHCHDTGLVYYAHAGNWVPLAPQSSILNNFGSVAVAGQTTVTADSTSDQLTMAAGSNITITTDASTDTITIAAQANTGSVTFAATTIDSIDSSAIVFTPSVQFDSDISVGTDIIFPDGTRLSSATGVQGPQGNPGPQGPEGPPGPTGAGAGDVSSAGGNYVDNSIVRYSGTSGTVIQVSAATISDEGLVTAANFSGGGSALTSLSADNLSSGTVPDNRFPATLPTASGVNLTALNASNLGSGTVPVLRLGTTGTRDATTFLRGDNTWATPAGGGGAASNSFVTIAVAGQTSVAADSTTDTLTLVSGTGISITTDSVTDTITITNSSPNTTQNTFTTVAVAGQSSVEADSATDTLTLAAGSGITITTNASTDTVTITNSQSPGATAFTGLSDRADLTIDQFYLPAITRLNVTANGSTSYRFDQYGNTDNPNIYAITGTTIAFNLNVAGHPFLIQSLNVNITNSGLIHVSTTGTVSTGAAAQGQTSGTLYFKVPFGQGGLTYRCSVHSGMNGFLFFRDISII